MTYNDLHTLSVLLVFISFSCKILLHYYLDDKHHKSINVIYSLLTPLPFFQKYNSVVNSNHLKIKKLCNLFLYLTIFFFILNLVIGIILYIKI